MSTYCIIKRIRKKIEEEKENIFGPVGEKCGTWEHGFMHGRLNAFQVCLELCFLYGFEENEEDEEN